MRHSETDTAAAPRTIVRPASFAHAELSCASCSVHRACLACGLSTSELETFSAMVSSKRKVPRGSFLARAGDALQALYVVHSGALKTMSTYRDGREKVTGFYLPGDVVGLDAVDTRVYAYDAAALEDSDVCVIPFESLERLSHTTPTLLQELFRALSADIARDDGLLLLLGGMNAEERLAAFLLSLSRRYHRLGYAPDRFSLRMTRRDIASYLGLSLETVCRLFTRFRQEGWIVLRQRYVRITGFAGLKQLVSAWPLQSAAADKAGDA